ncbi:MAG: hypothetical protein K0Q79_2794 [Flavipsychrobacter sp.]|jgi:hypothetical protein|nr:hypothetical protein [Flavipsychrobacter sp.]
MRALAFVLIVALLSEVPKTLAQSSALPRVLVYKTKAKYRNLVPVQLSPDKKAIVSYPATTDVVSTGSGFPLPVALHEGYWLDRVGISRNTAYLKLTYKEYSKLVTQPTAEELYKMIIDKAPITEVCDCGLRSGKNTSVTYLNGLIDKKQLTKKCKRLK